MTSSTANTAMSGQKPATESVQLLDLLQGVQDPSSRVMCEDMLKQVFSLLSLVLRSPACAAGSLASCSAALWMVSTFRYRSQSGACQKHS